MFSEIITSENPITMLENKGKDIAWKNKLTEMGVSLKQYHKEGTRIT